MVPYGAELADVTTCFNILSNGQTCKDLFEDVIIQHSRSEVDHVYFKEYVWVGIPTRVYNRVIVDVNRLYKINGGTVASVHSVHSAVHMDHCFS